MIKELDLAALEIDLPAHGLVAGDIGTVVMVHGKGVGYREQDHVDRQQLIWLKQEKQKK